MNPTEHRDLNFVAKVLDEPKGIVEYVASDESVDTDRELIRARGWTFEKSLPFIDSHKRGSIDAHLGKVVHAEVKGGRLVETVQWATDVPENRLAQQGFKMVQAGYGSRVSVGFIAKNVVFPEDREFTTHLRELGIKDGTHIRRIFDGQHQVELSAVLVGANLNALALGFKAGIFTEADLEHFDTVRKASTSRASAADAAHAESRRARQRDALFLRQLHQIIQKL